MWGISQPLLGVFKGFHQQSAGKQQRKHTKSFILSEGQGFGVLSDMKFDRWVLLGWRDNSG